MLSLSFVHWLVVLSAVVSVLGAYAYIRDTLSGKTKPNRISWGMWALAPLVGTVASVSAGVDKWATVRVFLGGFLPLLVFLASFINPQSYWKLNIFDLVCGVLSILALAVLVWVESPRLAILLAISGDGFASIPTLLKAWRYPHTETTSTYIASFVSSALVMPSIVIWNIENAAFQIYLLLINAALLFALYRKKQKVK